MIPPRIKSIKLNNNYDIEIEYENNEKKLYTMKKINIKLFEPKFGMSIAPYIIIYF